MNQPWYQSQSFLAVLAFIVGLFVNAVGKKFGVSLDSEQIVAFAAVVIGFLAKRGWQKAAELKADTAAAALPAPASPADALKEAGK